MAKVYYRGNLSSAIFPMTVSAAGRAVIMPGPDNNFDRRVDPAGEQKDAGIPQAIYLENVMPTVSGYQSVGYLQPKLAPAIPSGQSIVDVIELDVKIGAVFLKVPVFSLSDNITYLSGDTAQGLVTIVGANPGGQLRTFASTAVVNDTAYMYIAGKLYTVTGTTPNNITLTDITATVTPSGFFTTFNIGAIAGSNNYLVGANATTVFYSSLTTPTDFVTSLISGAGSIKPNDLKGQILRLSETQNGFYILASESTILAKYTGNNRYPWKFIPVKNLSGAPSREGAFYGNVQSKGEYVLDTNNQVKFINGETAEDIGPEVSEFLANGTIQQFFISSLNSFTNGRSVTRFARIHVLSDRYIMVSMDNPNSDTSYNGVIVYDIALKRYGKLAINHKYIYDATAVRANAGGGNIRKTVGFLDTSNRVFLLEFGPYGAAADYTDYNILTQQSVLVLGKFQYARSRWIKLHEIVIEGVRSLSLFPSAQNFNCALLSSRDGYTFVGNPPDLISNYTAQNLITYPAHSTVQNFALALKGSFDLSTIQLTFSPAGER